MRPMFQDEDAMVHVPQPGEGPRPVTKKPKKRKWSSDDPDFPSEVVPADEFSLATSLDDLDFAGDDRPAWRREADEGWRRIA